MFIGSQFKPELELGRIVSSGGGTSVSRLRLKRASTRRCSTSVSEAHHFGETTILSETSSARLKMQLVTRCAGTAFSDLSSKEPFFGEELSQVKTATPPFALGKIVSVTQSRRACSNSRPVKVTCGRNVVETMNVGAFLNSTT